MDYPLRSRRGLTSNPDLTVSSPSQDSTKEAASDFYIPSASSTKQAYPYEKSTAPVPAVASKHRPKPSFVESLGGNFNLSRGEGRVLAGLVLLGSVVRFWRIDRPDSVV